MSRTTEPQALPRTQEIGDTDFLADTPHARQVIKRLLDLVLVIALVVAPLVLYSHPDAGQHLIPAAGTIAVVALSRWQLRHGPRAALVAAGGGLWCVAAVAMLAFAGVRGTATIVFPFVVVLAGWTLSSRWAYIVAAASINVIVLAGIAEYLGLYHPLPPGTTLTVAAIQSALLVASAFLVSVVVKSFNRRRLDAVRLSEELAEQLLRVAQREQELDLIVENAPAMIAAGDDQLRFRFVNRSYASFHGHTPDQLVGRPIADVLVNAAPHTLEAMRAVLASGQRGTYRREETDARTGETRILAVDLVPHRDVADRPGFIALVRDVTEQAQAEAALAELNESLERRVAERTAELERAYETLKRSQDELSRADRMAALGALVAGLSHELGTPIGNGVMTASLIGDQSKKLSEAIEGGSVKRSQLTDFLTQLREGTDLMQRNLYRAKDLLASFKQVAVDQTSESRRRFDLLDTTREILDTLSPVLKRKPQRVDVDIDAGIVLDSYPGPLGQVVINLINNAFLHAFEGRTDGILRLAAQTTADGYVTLTVADDGCGIDAAHVPHVFDPFFTTKAGKGGTGLGLNIVHNLVTGPLGGTIDIRSEPGRGTTFSLSLPLVAPAPSHHAA